MNRRFAVAVALLATVVAALLYVRGRFFRVELSYAYAKREALRTQLEEDKRKLILELATLKNPARIERIARGELGLTRTQAQVDTIDTRGGGGR